MASTILTLELSHLCLFPWQECESIFPSVCSWTVESAPGTSEDKGLTRCLILSPGNLISLAEALKTKTTLRKGFPLRHRIVLRCDTISAFWLGNCNSIPFKKRGNVHVSEVSLSLRIDQPMSHCCLHGTFLHVGLKTCYFNICYYLQYLQ